MTRMTLRLLAIMLSSAPLLLPAAAHAQSTTQVLAQNSDLNLTVFLSTLLYGVLGIALCLLGYFVFDRVAGLQIQRELVEDQNVAIAIMLAGAFIGIAIVVAAVMIS